MKYNASLVAERAAEILESLGYKKKQSETKTKGEL